MPLTLVLLISFVLAEPTTAPATRPTSQPAAELSPDDQRVVALCLEDFRYHKESPFRHRESDIDKQIVIHRVANEGGNWLLAQQMTSRGWFGKIPKSLLEALAARARETSKQNLDGLKLDDARIVIGDIDKVPKQWEFVQLTETYPDALVYVQIWLPAYARDRAIFRFWFGPTPHGASATYLLRKNRRGHWEIDACKISYYA